MRGMEPILSRASKERISERDWNVSVSEVPGERVLCMKDDAAGKQEWKRWKREKRCLQIIRSAGI
ncbi:hypothetical protein J3A84_07710 [Proteiniclasticum sp. SCR006]|uniref:Uncharacterized protein n=1 Tax=Proteiniclasticum aestuarii TaxID=2817862 RepID=A0A939HBF0_9CLOT|nr:hypothetical protein [Proteiniclasticum aestuarii]MBO1264911.1 hypothetical protein [Proteiniclasticum aestuarii]